MLCSYMCPSMSTTLPELHNPFAQALVTDAGRAQNEPTMDSDTLYDDEEEIDSSSAQAASKQASNNTCETCDRTFRSYWQYQRHMSEHRTCNIDGCTFTAHEKVIEKHVEMQHCTGLYDRMRNLITPEDITKWIEERKKRYPSKENVEKRYQQQEEMLKRGEKLKGNASRFDKNNKTRYALNRRTHQQNRKSVTRRRQAQRRRQDKPISLIDDKSDWNGTLYPFKGTDQLYHTEVTVEMDNYDDAEWTEDAVNAPVNIPIDGADGTSIEGATSKPKQVIKSALGALMSAYDSSGDSQNEDEIPQNQVTNGDIVLSDNDAPIEQKIERCEAPPIEQKIEVPALTPNSDNKNAHKRKRVKRKRPDVGKRGRYNTHSNTDAQSSSKTNEGETVAFSHNYRKRRVTLLERLLAHEISHERNVLLQCVRHVVAHGFFDVKENEGGSILEANDSKSDEVKITSSDSLS